MSAIETSEFGSSEGPEGEPHEELGEGENTERNPMPVIAQRFVERCLGQDEGSLNWLAREDAGAVLMLFDTLIKNFGNRPPLYAKELFRLSMLLTDDVTDTEISDESIARFGGRRMGTNAMQAERAEVQKLLELALESSEAKAFVTDALALLQREAGQLSAPQPDSKEAGSPPESENPPHVAEFKWENRPEAERLSEMFHGLIPSDPELLAIFEAHFLDFDKMPSATQRRALQKPLAKFRRTVSPRLPSQTRRPGYTPVVDTALFNLMVGSPQNGVPSISRAEYVKRVYGPAYYYPRRDDVELLRVFTYLRNPLLFSKGEFWPH